MNPSDALRGAVLALDTGSADFSVALGRAGTVLAERSAPGRQASERLLDLVTEVLFESGTARADLTAILALRGPGSFTGLRIGLATAIGLAESLDLEATALPTLPVLASTAATPAADSGEPPIVAAAVDALRGEWFVQLFRGAEEMAAPDRVPLESLPALGADRFVGLGLSAACADHDDEALRALPVQEPPHLAAAALRFASLNSAALPWDRSLLSAPLYLRAPNIRIPTRP